MCKYAYMYSTCVYIDEQYTCTQTYMYMQKHNFLSRVQNCIYMYMYLYIFIISLPGHICEQWHPSPLEWSC